MKGSIRVGNRVSSDLKSLGQYHRCGTTSTLVHHSDHSSNRQQTPFQGELQLPSRPIKTSTERFLPSASPHLCPLCNRRVYRPYVQALCCARSLWAPPPLQQESCATLMPEINVGGLFASPLRLSDILPREARCRASESERSKLIGRDPANIVCINLVDQISRSCPHKPNRSGHIVVSATLNELQTDEEVRARTDLATHVRLVGSSRQILYAL